MEINQDTECAATVYVPLRMVKIINICKDYLVFPAAGQKGLSRKG